MRNDKLSRRELFKGTAVAGVATLLDGAGVAAPLTAGNPQPGGSNPQESGRSAQPVEESPAGDDYVLGNGQLRARIRPDNLSVFVDDLATGESWGPDPWEHSAGRIQLRSKHGEKVALGLGGAQQKHIEPIQSQGETGLRLSLADFHSRMGPVREDRDPGSQLSLVLAIRLARTSPDLTFEIQDLQNNSRYWTVETIEWPLRLFPVRTVEDDGYVVLSQEQGIFIPSRFPQGYFRYLNWIWERIAGQAAIFSSVSMPWFGAKKGNSSFICIIETPDDVAYGLIANDVRAPGQPPAPPSAIPAQNTALFAPRLSAVWPLWASVKGQLGYPRRARYRFQPRSGYVEMCKTYRQYAQKTGKFITLQQKIAANPEVEKLIGAPNFEIMILANHPREPQFQGLSGAVYDGYHRLLTTFDQVTGIVHDLKNNLRVERAVIRIAGWGQMGYDNYRPIDELPVGKEAGGPVKLAAAIQAAKSVGYLCGLFDNYRNLDLDSPSYDEKYIMRDYADALVPGFSSEGGHSQEICALEGVKLIRHNVDYYLRALKPNMLYLDTIGGLSLTECYDSRHPLTRSETREARLNIMRTPTDAKLVLGAEAPMQDWNLKLASFYDEHPPPRFGIEVPLYGMVYHECVVLYRQHSSPYDYGTDEYGYVRQPWPSKILRGLLHGDESSWTISNREYWAWRDKFKAINDVLTPHHRRLAHEELLSHEFLTPDFLVQRTRFSSGVEVTVNYGPFLFKLDDGSKLDAYGYRVKDSSPGGRSFGGSVKTEIVAST